MVKHNYLKRVEIKNQSYYVPTPEAIKLVKKYEEYFNVAKKKTNTQIMGGKFMMNIKQYREYFPAKKLPSGKPARNNVKVLEAAFRWFFNEYDFTWEEIHNATRQYVDQYEQNDYMYMKTSQYFVAKQDKTKVKYSELADYCDMIREGIEPDKHFKEKVV